MIFEMTDANANMYDFRNLRDERHRENEFDHRWCVRVQHIRVYVVACLR